MFTKHIAICCCFLLAIACSDKKVEEAVQFDTNFKGARLDSIKKIGDNEYMALVLPENEPINQSPWFAFAVSSKTPKNIRLTLDYGTYQHRYVPKVSYDKINWKSLNPSSIIVDTITHTAVLSLDISAQIQYIAAQEVISSDDTYAWVAQQIEKNPTTLLEVAGKSSLGNDNLVMVHESEDIKNSIVLIARQHPPEIPGGTIGFQTFYETLFSNTEWAIDFRGNFNIYTFPLLNPDGADAGNWRHNANGVDLNRDWVEFSQPETKMVRDFLDTKIDGGKKIRFALDFHTSHSGPYLLVLDSINEVQTKKIIPDWISKIETNSNFKVEARRRSQDLPYCYNYFFNRFGSEAVTYEDGDEMDRELIKKRAQVHANELMKTLLEKLNKRDFDE
ncbi:M14 family metallopeptidase [Muricauda sp. 2012CJ35-5]|uniref:M14 family metallopeptidase n=1 Tax=Flagellimonas spongiicola TaxID=2942208 RepID=A0ABT0PW96_9FLAO|nr:M14 family metallopeptidase [Allomuricauda spongiicola]MCL6275466.1 M14 family metallopeptidase [Allomuricauda spongiicola]